MKTLYSGLIVFLLLLFPLGSLYAVKPVTSPPNDPWALSIGRDAHLLAKSRSKVKPPANPLLDYSALRRAVLAQGSGSEYNPFQINPTLKGMENYNRAYTPVTGSSGKK